MLLMTWQEPGYLLFLPKSLGHGCMPTLGLRMDDDDAIRVAVGLRLGSTLCRPHSCQHCGAEVDRLGLAVRKVRDVISTTRPSMT